nr:putative reverse transcriptase, RNA-dependent DNA polymerase [Tanacetum cinerariifolium]
MANIAKGNLSKEAKAFVASVYSDEIPANTEQALKSRKWKKAMEEEMKDLTKNNTWEKCVLPPEKKIVGCRVLCFVTANKGWPLHQFDVKNAFLHGELKEEVYMEAPHGFTNKFGEREDIRTGAIIGRGTKTKGLYYVDEVTQNGVVMLSYGTAEREAWLWHRRLGHPSNGYLHVLFPKLFPSNTGMIDCKPADTPIIVNQKLYMEEKAEQADKERYQQMEIRATEDPHQATLP